ncbi:MAG: 3'-5' exoribonuclease YhaM family protein [Desulfohalobiaceae bacterium]
MQEKSTFIQDLKQGQKVREIFALARARLAQSKNGPYWDLSLQDCTGELEAKIWPPLSREYESLQPEQLVLVQGEVREFREQLQLVLKQLQVLDAEQAELDWGQFVLSSSVPPEELLQELEALCRDNLKHRPWRKLCRQILHDPEIRTRLLSAPAAKAMHHAYRGGLLEHTLAVSRHCLYMADLHQELDREILLVAAVLHDLGKAWELELGLSREYTDQGRLLGHILLGLEKLEPFLHKTKDLQPELAMHLKHLIASHHGEYVFGSPKLPMTSEALALHYADNLDAKLHSVRQATAGIEPAAESQWSAYQRSLERQFYLAPDTRDFQGQRQRTQKERMQQCLLPLKE